MPAPPAKRTISNSNSSRRNSSTRKTLIAVTILAIVGLACFALRRSNIANETDQPESAKSGLPGESARSARKLSYEVVSSYPHDPGAFLQGLVWHDGGFYEGTGLEGRSTLRRVEFPSGKVAKSISLAPDLFGEGLALVKDQLIQITWKSHRGFVYDRESFRLLREFQYDTEGWGITYDGKNLIMSDGSDVLTFLDPETFKPVRKLPVVMNGRPLPALNELEFIEGEVWANVWQTDAIVQIDPNSGQVRSYLDLQGILPLNLRTGNEDVLNGIAYDPQAKRIFVGGKFWARLFEIRVKE
jgi:glutamine cyclotransferase